MPSPVGIHAEAFLTHVKVFVWVIPMLIFALVGARIHMIFALKIVIRPTTGNDKKEAFWSFLT